MTFRKRRKGFKMNRGKIYCIVNLNFFESKRYFVNLFFNSPFKASQL